MIPEILVFSKRVWNGLSRRTRPSSRSSPRKAQQRQRKLWYEMEEALADMRANGVEVIKIADKKPFQDAVKPVWDKYGAQHKELIQRIPGHEVVLASK